MRFDFCVGNPPYQANNSGTSKYAPSVYHNFMDAAYTISDKVEMITPGRFLFNSGATPKKWNEAMLKDIHFKVLKYYNESRDVFSGVNIAGGIAITYKDNNKEFMPIEVFAVFPEINSLMSKVKAFPSIQKELELQTRYHLDVILKEHPECIDEISGHGTDKRLNTNAFEKVSLFHKVCQENDAVIFGLINSKRVYRYINKKYIDNTHNSYAKYKVVVPKAAGSGVLEAQSSFISGQPEILSPNVGYTQSFIAITSSDVKKDVENASKYLKTKFSRACLGILKATQDNPPEKWRYVPIQNFTDNSDIDWSQSIPDIDKQLYVKYGLSQEEIDFIETHVKPME